MKYQKLLVYPKAYAFQERGGKTYKVVTDLVKHANGKTTCNQVARGLNRYDALKMADEINRMVSGFPRQARFRTLNNV